LIARRNGIAKYMIFRSPAHPSELVDNFVDNALTFPVKPRGSVSLLECPIFQRSPKILRINGLANRARVFRGAHRAKPHEIGMDAIL
jgi:hypothetical protein